jgi:transmembrane sensor
MAESLPQAPDLPLLEQAAGWFDRVSNEALSPKERAEFDRWRAMSPAHGYAFAEIEAAHAQVISAAEDGPMLALRHEALSRIVMPRAQVKRRFAVGGAIAASLLAVAGAWTFGGAGQLSTNSFNIVSGAKVTSTAPTVYRTAVGERLTVTLPDGSSATLNTASRLRLAYTAVERRLVLEQGQALFHVAKGQARPFIVQALNRIVTAHGTTFDVQIGPNRKVKVSLVEGLVTVADTSAPSAPAMQLRPNDILVASNNVVAVSREPEIEREVSWRNGLIIFEDESLADAVSEVNRYVQSPIILQDERLRRIRVSGAFRTGETAAFVEALQLSFPVRVTEQNNQRIVLAYRG